MMKTATIIFSGFVFLVPAQGFSFFDNVLDGLGSFGLAVPSELSEDKVIAGLKEALEVGTANAVNLTGATDGFLQNEAIKIAMPSQLQQLDQALRMVGYGPQLDEFVASMNRGAEQATALAKPIFIDTI